MAIRPDETQILGTQPLGDNMNPLQGQWLSKEFRQFSEIADFLNDARVGLMLNQVVWANNRFYALFLVDGMAKIVKKTRKKKGK